MEPPSDGDDGPVPGEPAEPAAPIPDTTTRQNSRRNFLAPLIVAFLTLTIVAGIGLLVAYVVLSSSSETPAPAVVEPTRDLEATIAAVVAAVIVPTPTISSPAEQPEAGNASNATPVATAPEDERPSPEPSVTNTRLPPLPSDRITDNDAASEIDYDTDDDGLIEVSNLPQLNAIRWDLDGDGVTNQEFGLRLNSQGHPSHEAGSSFAADYAAAFPNAAPGMGCPSSGCEGYELTADLDFNTSANGAAGAAYWGGKEGWRPIGSFSSNLTSNRIHFSGVFDGNGHTIRNPRMEFDTYSTAGFFAGMSANGVIRDLNLESADVSGDHRVGVLVGTNRGTIADSHVSGAVMGSASVGGLVGENKGTGVIRSSCADVSVTGTKPVSEDGRDVGGLVGFNEGAVRASCASGDVSGKANNTGGLVGNNAPGGSVTASYASGDVSGSGRYIGGLVGTNWGPVTASYASGNTMGGADTGGLVGHNGSTVTNGYWNSDRTQATVTAGVGKTTTELQSPTGYTGIYANWNVDLDYDGRANDPWDFGTSCQYPVLKYGALNPDDQRAPCTPP